MLKLRKKFSKYRKVPLKSPPLKKHWAAFPWTSTPAQAEAHSKAIEPIEEIAFNLTQTMDMSAEEKEAELKGDLLAVQQQIGEDEISDIYTQTLRRRFNDKQTRSIRTNTPYCR